MQTLLYLITQSEMGGAQKYVFDLATGLKDEYKIHVGFGEQGDGGEMAKKLKEQNIQTHSIPKLIRAISPLKDFKALTEIIKLIKKVKPDIIHLNSTKISILGSIAVAWIRIIRINSHIRTVYTAHGWVFNEPMNPLKKFFYKFTEQATALEKDKIICVSDYDKLVGLKNRIGGEKKLVTIHNGIEKINFTSRKEAREKLAEKLKIKNLESNIIIGTVGNLYKTKGHEYLIKAIKILITDYGLQTKLIIIGEGSERESLEKLIKEEDLEDKVFLPGRINMRESIPGFDIFANSSVKEGLSYTIIEALQAGLPIVATRVGGNPEIVEDNVSGLLVESKNPEELTRAFEKLINNKELREKLAANAKKKAEEFSLDKMINKTKEIYI